MRRHIGLDPEKGRYREPSNRRPGLPLGCPDQTWARVVETATSEFACRPASRLVPEQQAEARRLTAVLRQRTHGPPFPKVSIVSVFYYLILI